MIRSAARERTAHRLRRQGLLLRGVHPKVNAGRLREDGAGLRLFSSATTLGLGASCRTAATGCLVVDSVRRCGRRLTAPPYLIDAIERLRGLVRAADRGVFKIGFITGERGIGKSSLASFVRCLCERDGDVTGCHVYPRGGAAKGAQTS